MHELEKADPQYRSYQLLPQMGPASSKKIMFWGDSHVQQLYPLIERLHNSGALGRYGVLFAVDEGCKPAEHLNSLNSGFYCDSFTQFALMRAEQTDIDTGYIGFAAPDYDNWDYCLTLGSTCVRRVSREVAIQQLLRDLSWNVRRPRMLGKQVIVSLPFPLFDRPIPDLEICNLVLQRFGFPALAAAQISPAALRNEIASVAENDGAYIFDPRKSLCRNDDCINEVDGVSIYKDDSHIADGQIRYSRGEHEKRAASGHVGRGWSMKYD